MFGGLPSLREPLRRYKPAEEDEVPLYLHKSRRKGQQPRHAAKRETARKHHEGLLLAPFTSIKERGLVGRSEAGEPPPFSFGNTLSVSDENDAELRELQRVLHDKKERVSAELAQFRRLGSRRAVEVQSLRFQVICHRLRSPTGCSEVMKLTRL